LLLGLLGVVAYALGARLKRHVSARTTWDERRYNFIIELLNGIHTIKGLGMEALMLRRYQRLQESAVMANHDVTFMSALAQNAGAVISNITMISVAAIGSLLVIRGELSVGGLAASIVLAGRSIQPLLRAMGLCVSSFSCSASALLPPRDHQSTDHQQRE